MKAFSDQNSRRAAYLTSPCAAHDLEFSSIHALTHAKRIDYRRVPGRPHESVHGRATGTSTGGGGFEDCGCGADAEVRTDEGRQ